MKKNNYFAVITAMAFAAAFMGVAPVLAQTRVDVGTGIGVTAGFHGGPGPARIPGIYGTGDRSEWHCT